MSEPTVERCPACGDLPDHLVIRTGRGEQAPAGANALEVLAPLDIRRSGGTFCTERQLLRCRHCRCLFDWQDEPQYMGSGNLDEERYTRFPMHQSRVASDFLDDVLENPATIFDTLPHDFLWLLLDACAGESIQNGHHLTILRKVAPAIRKVIPGIVEHMVHRDATLLRVLRKLVDHAPESAVDVLAAFERAAQVPDEARELIDNCKRTLRRMRREKKR